MSRVLPPPVTPTLSVGDYLDGKATHEAWFEAIALMVLAHLKEKRHAKPQPALWWLPERGAE